MACDFFIIVCQIAAPPSSQNNFVFFKSYFSSNEKGTEIINEFVGLVNNLLQIMYLIAMGEKNDTIIVES